MPAIDNLFGNGAIHIADRNKKNPVATLCGQALDKESIRFFENADNFDQATCKVCRKSFFDESWAGETQPPANQGEKAEAPSEVVPASRTTLFGNLTIPVNRHPPVEEKTDGD